MYIITGALDGYIEYLKSKQEIIQNIIKSRKFVKITNCDDEKVIGMKGYLIQDWDEYRLLTGNQKSYNSIYCFAVVNDKKSVLCGNNPFNFIEVEEIKK